MKLSAKEKVSLYVLKALYLKHRNCHTEDLAALAKQGLIYVDSAGTTLKTQLHKFMLFLVLYEDADREQASPYRELASAIGKQINEKFGYPDPFPLYLKALDATTTRVLPSGMGNPMTGGGSFVPSRIQLDYPPPSGGDRWDYDYGKDYSERSEHLRYRNRAAEALEINNGIHDEYQTFLEKVTLTDLLRDWGVSSTG